MKQFLLLGAAMAATALASCNSATSTENPAPNQTEQTKAPTIEDAREFLKTAEQELDAYGEVAARTYWINANFITADTIFLAAKVGEEGALLATKYSKMARQFDDLNLPTDMRRKIDGLKRGSSFPAPDKPGAAKELATIMTGLESSYGTGKGELDGEMKTLGALSDIIAKSRDPERLQAAWQAWRTISPPMKKDYARMVEIINEGSKELGYADTGALWRGGYDMPADDFTKEANRLWDQVKPLYDELHCHVRAELNGKYGDEVVPLDQPIRADLLGNMWGQAWGNIYDMMVPSPKAKSLNETQLLIDAGYDARKMTRQADSFFQSMGFEKLPDTFWERSLFTKPRDREVVCHASAWPLGYDDYRMKMCIKITGDEFKVIHHELGHNFYQRAYRDQPVFYRDGAHDGFHEAIGDMISLSITPDYLVKIGLLDAKDVPPADADLNLLMQQALDKVAFLPFGLMVDQWRWKVFSGEYSPSEYNKGWWELREKFQGLRPPVDRSEADFDPGAKFHIPGNTPYMRYFLAHILQFQFHKAACDMAGFEGPLHRCSIYGNTKVGKRFNAMLEMGSSKPWPDALEAFTGTREMDGSAIVEYFAPLMTYLKKENATRKCGW